MLETCQRLGLSVRTSRPGTITPAAGTLIEGYPLDPGLAAFYSRFGQATFAGESAGMGLFRLDDEVNELAKENAQWRSGWQQRQLGLSLFLFGGEPGLAYYHATVPTLADERGLQPVVLIDAGVDPCAVPVASSVDRLFDTYALFLEALVSHPDYAQARSAALTFPWGVPELLARDERLVQLVRAGHFDSLMPQDEETRQWVSRLLGTRMDG